MAALLIALHVLACVVLIAVVLMQSGKGEGLSSTIGGGMTQTVFGPRASSFLTKLTAGVAVLFLLTSLFLARTSSFQSSSVMQRVAEEQPVAGTVPAETPVPDAPSDESKQAVPGNSSEKPE